MFPIRKMQSIAIAAAMLCCFAGAGVAGTPSVTYTGSGVFANPADKGNDLLELAGQQFTLSVTVSEAAKPIHQSPTYAIYGKVPVTGTVYSALLPGEAIPLTAGTVGNFELSVGATGEPDTLWFTFTQVVIGVNLKITCRVFMPHGTITTPQIVPFATVTLGSDNGMVSYSDTTAATVLGFASGTLTATE
jgi:hypothetical protein